MPLMNWSEQLSIHVPTVDQQHQKLVNLINELHDSMLKGQGKETTGKVLKELVTYTKTHFTYEEGLQKKYNYPGFANHQKIHTDLIKQVEELEEKFKAGTALISMTVMKFLKEWLSNHILVEDKKVGDFLRTKNVK